MKFTSKYEAPWASPDELHILPTGDWRYQRPVAKASKCCHCATCYIFCSLGCIRDMGTHFEANLDYCKGCGVCARLCPVNAIAMVREV